MAKLTPIPRRRFEAYLRSIGCELLRTEGDHLIYGRADLRRHIIIQADPTIPKFIIKSNLRTLGVSTVEFLETLRKIK